jgi:hypothetical protein
VRIKEIEVTGRMTGNPEVISSLVGLVTTNALVLTVAATFRVPGCTEVICYLETVLWFWSFIYAHLRLTCPLQFV